MIITGEAQGPREAAASARFWGLFGRHWPLLAIAIVIGAIGGISLFTTTTKRYVATAVVALDARKVTVAPEDSVVSRLPDDNPALRTEIDVIESRSMAATVVEKLGIGTFGPLLAAPASPRRTDSDAKQYNRALIDRLIGGLQVSNDGRSLTIYISFTASDPVFAAKIANAYAKEYLDHQTAIKLNAIRSASEWLGTKVDELRRKLERSERAVDNNDVKNLNELEREVEANRSIYDSFLKRYKATIEQEDLAGPEAQLISEAEPPSRPSTPKILPLLALGIFVGAAGGVGAAFARDYFDDRVWSAAGLEERTGLPIWGALPVYHVPTRNYAAWRSGWLARLQRHLPVPPVDDDHALQRLQAVLRLAPATSKAKVIAVTSALQREGKTSVSIALARAFAAAGDLALVVGIDGHGAALAERLHLQFSLSWTQILTGARPIDDVVQWDPSGISIIAADTSSAGPKALFSSPAFKTLIARLCERYDRIIIDTPPIVSSADSAIVGAAADVMILVVRWRKTTYAAVTQALRQMTLCSLPAAGIVLSQPAARQPARAASLPIAAPVSRNGLVERLRPATQVLRFGAVSGGRDAAKSPAAGAVSHD